MLLRVRPRRRHRLAVAPQDRILDVVEHLRPRVELDVVRVDVDDEVVLQVVAFDVAPGVGEDLARVGARRDLLRLARANGWAFDDLGHRCSLIPVRRRGPKTTSAMSNGVRSCERRSAHASVIASVVETSGVSGGSSLPARSEALA